MTLEQFFSENPSIAVGFSGGVDSAYLLWIAKKHAKKVGAYYVKTEFQPNFEYEDAKKFAKLIDIELTVIEKSVLLDESITQNSCNRCYYCKKLIFNSLVKKAEEDGFTVVVDGSNASDDIDDRPGMKALLELSVISPLRECNLSKQEIRRLSKEAGLFTWNKPAYACLATRIPTARLITKDLLERIEKAEDALFALGFLDFRVRVYDEAARLQFPLESIDTVVNMKKEIVLAIKPYFSIVLLDMEGR